VGAGGKALVDDPQTVLAQLKNSIPETGCRTQEALLNVSKRESEVKSISGSNVYHACFNTINILQNM
jgi:hypothetical protein